MSRSSFAIVSCGVAAVASAATPSGRRLSAQSPSQSQFSILFGAANRDVRGYQTATPWGYGLAARLERTSTRLSNGVWTISGARFAAKPIVVPLLSGTAMAPAVASFTHAADAWQKLEVNQGQGRLSIVSAAVGTQHYLFGATRGPYLGLRAGLVYLGVLGQHYLRPTVEGSVGYAANVGPRVRVLADVQGSWMGATFAGRQATAPRWLVRPGIGISVTK